MGKSISGLPGGSRRRPVALGKDFSRPKPPRCLHRDQGPPNPSLHHPPGRASHGHLKGAENFLLIHHADRGRLISRQLAALAQLDVLIGVGTFFHLVPQCGAVCGYEGLVTGASAECGKIYGSRLSVNGRTADPTDRGCGTCANPFGKRVAGKRAYPSPVIGNDLGIRTGPGRGGDAAEIVSTAMVFQSVTASPRATGDQLSATTAVTKIGHWLKGVRDMKPSPTLL